MASRSGAGEMELSAENIGGIEETCVVLQPGVNVLVGHNASNRTSLLQAIMAALGSERATLKGDADEGRVELALDGDTYSRRLVRHNGGVSHEGEPYLEDPELADLFAFLLESNEARRAVERGADLRELIMRPIDTDELHRRIERLESEKREIDADVERLEELAEERGDLETRRSSLEAEIERREDELAEIEAELDAHESDVSEAPDPLEEAMGRLRRARAELDELEYDIETERETREQLEAEREEIRAELADEADVDDPDELAGRLEELRERERALDDTVAGLQRVIGFNEDRLDEGGLAFEAAETAEDDAAITDDLLEGGDEIACWTCGSTVERERIEATLDRLRGLHRAKLDERREVGSRIEELADRQAEIRERERRRTRLEERLEAVETELSAVQDRLDRLAAEREEAAALVDELEAETESAGGDHEAFLERHREATQIELEIDRREEEVASIDDRLAEIDAELERRGDLADSREEIREELTALRTRIDRIEAEAVEAFNDHVAQILAVLEYENVDRVWIERGGDAVFDLHVVRTTASGEAYEDTVEHLSESEREVTGLVFALAGYLVHEAYESVPFVLLDSLEAIDSGRIARLVEYFEEFTDCLVVALLPEDAAALAEEYTYHREI